MSLALKRNSVRILLLLAVIVALVTFFVGGNTMRARAASMKPLVGCSGGAWFREELTGNTLLGPYNGHYVDVNTNVYELETNDGTFRFCGEAYGLVNWECDDCSGQGNAPTIEIFLWKGNYTTFSQVGYANNGTASHSNGVWHSAQTPIYNNCNGESLWGQSRLKEETGEHQATSIDTIDDPFC